MADDMFSMGLAQKICSIASQTVSMLSKTAESGRTSFNDVLNGKIESQIPSAEMLSGTSDETVQTDEGLLKDIPLLAQAAVNPESAQELLAQTQTDSTVFLLRVLKQLLESVAKDMNSQGKKDRNEAGDMLTMLFRGKNEDEDDYASENGLFSFLMTPVTQSDLDFISGSGEDMLSLPGTSDRMIDYTGLNGMQSSISAYDLAENLFEAKNVLTGRIDELISQMTAGTEVSTQTNTAEAVMQSADGETLIPQAAENAVVTEMSSENGAAENNTENSTESGTADAVSALKKQTAVRDAGSELEELIAANTGREVHDAGAAEVKAAREETLMSVRVQTAEKVLGMISEMRGDNAPVKELSVTLNPETLGKIAVRVTQESSGISISIAAQNRSTEDLIRDSMGSLVSAVRDNADANVQIRIVEATDAAFASGFGLEDYGSQAQQQYRGSGYGGEMQDVTDDAAASETYVREAALWETA